MAAKQAKGTPEECVPETFEQFLAELKLSARQTGQPILNPQLFATVLCMDLQSLAASAHVHRSTLRRAPGSEKLQSYLRNALRVLRAATDINGDFRSAIFWFRHAPLSAFDDRTAEALVADGRTDDLLRYVCALQDGATG